MSKHADAGRICKAGNEDATAIRDEIADLTS